MSRARKSADRTAPISGIPPSCSIEEFTPYHYRLNGTLDIYPNRWHNLITGKRGDYFGKSEEEMAKFILKQLEAANAAPKRARPISGLSMPGTCAFCQKSTESFFMCADCRTKSYFELMGLKSAKGGVT